MARTQRRLSEAGKAVAAGGLAVLLSGCISFASLPGSEAGRPDNLASLRAQALELVNADRSQHGLPPLRQDDVLNRIAQSHASDQLSRGYYGHVSPGGKGVQDRYLDAGGNKWRLVQENIATCRGCDVSADRVERFETGWMNSPGHRENILREGIDRFGFGIAGEDGRVHAVQTFSGPGSSNGGSETEASASEIQNAAVQAINEARRSAGVSPLQASDALRRGASAMLPEPGARRFEPGSMNALVGALSDETRARFSGFSTAIGICGGCGTKPTTADARDFVEQWLGTSRQREVLLAPGLTEVGVAVAADGEGKKIGLAAFGRAR
ncbi:hypothetical protein N177_2867 [Lutibaculum baratangense AMV1]|uniref:SCP domain-containing protein n=2 Tax=Lutibaculum TaxID=1358438 RepID=V4QW32_9HYPH|nr:hypothetical protein N177_2867 [Lutibaculum baratangense AMV1]